MSSVPKPPTISQFTNLSTAERLSYLLPLLSVCSHAELLSVQSALTKLFYRDFIQLPTDLVVRILRQLTLKDIKSCMLVSKTWYEVIHCTCCRTLWRMHSVQLAPGYNNICLTNHCIEWKPLCQIIKSFQNNFIQNFAYKNKPLMREGQDLRDGRVFRVFHSDDYLAIQGFDVKRSTDMILIWKLEGNEFVFKKNIFEGRSKGFDIGSFNSSEITVSFHDKFLLVAHIYLDIFEMSNLSLTSRILLPSMSGVLYLDFMTQERGLIHLIAILFSDYSIFVLEPSNGEIRNQISIERNALFHFSILPLPSLLIFSEFEFKILNLSTDDCFQRVASLQHHFRSTIAQDLSFQLSKDRELAAVKCDLGRNNAIHILHLYTTSNWLKIREINLLSLPTYAEYSIHSVGRKYVILLSHRRKLELVMCDVQGSDPMLKRVIFDELRACTDVFVCNSVVVLSERWLDGLVVEEITGMQRELILPMFLILTGDFLSSITTLFLHC